MNATRLEILVVDDTTSFAVCAAEIFNARDYLTSTAEDAESCLLQIRKHVPDLIIIDSNLPGMRGERAVSLIRQSHQNLPIIGISAEDREVVMKEAGANAFFKKPFEFQQLLSSVIELLPQS